VIGTACTRAFTLFSLGDKAVRAKRCGGRAQIEQRDRISAARDHHLHHVILNRYDRTALTT